MHKVLIVDGIAFLS